MKTYKILIVVIAIGIFTGAKAQNVQNNQTHKEDFRTKKLYPFNKHTSSKKLYKPNLISQEFTNSSSITKHRCDSIIGYDGQSNQQVVKFSCLYNTNNEKISTLTAYYIDDSTNTYIIDNKVETTYQGFNKTMEVFSNWNQQSSTWELYKKLEYAYNANNDTIMFSSFVFINNSWDGRKTENVFDANGRKILTQNFYWDDNSTSWKDQLKTIYTVNSIGLIISLERFQINSATNNFYSLPYSKIEYTYNAANKVILETEFQGNGISNLQMERTSTYTYDGQGNLILIVHDSLFGNNKVEMTYNAQNLQTSFILYFYDAIANTYVPSNKIEYDYDTHGNQTSEVYYLWNDNINEWFRQKKYEMTYDVQNNETSYTEFFWNPNLNSWIKSYKGESLYDITVPISSVMVPPYEYVGNLFYEEEFEPFKGNSKLLEMKEYFNNNDTLVLNAKYSLYYSDYISNNIVKLNTLQAKLFPNPANGYANFELANTHQKAVIEINDIEGRMITSENFVGKVTVPLTNYNSGIYIYKITSAEGNMVGKLVVE